MGVEPVGARLRLPPSAPVTRRPAPTSLALIPGGDDGALERSAEISPCGRYRYSLVRSWNPAGKRVCFVMLNPSVADAAIDDPTLKAILAMARALGFGSLVVVNLFAWRETDSTKLAGVAEPVGPLNDAAILAAAAESALVVCAWGTKGDLLGRDRVVYGMLASRMPQALRMTKMGHPEHPLYIPRDVSPVPFIPSWWKEAWVRSPAVQAAPPPRHGLDVVREHPPRPTYSLASDARGWFVQTSDGRELGPIAERTYAEQFLLTLRAQP